MPHPPAFAAAAATTARLICGATQQTGIELCTRWKHTYIRYAAALEQHLRQDGFVRFIDHMGNDNSIVRNARVSYGKGTKSVSDDRALIRYMMSHKHTTPFEAVEFQFHVRVPMDCHRQLIRHRTASVSEYSTRYSEAIDSIHLEYGRGAFQCVWSKQVATALAAACLRRREAGIVLGD